MKTILSTLAIASLSVYVAQAQTSYGIKAGTNLSKITNLEDQKYNPSYFITGYADIPLSGRFSLQPGISLQGKGTKTEGPIFSYDQKPTGVSKETLNSMSIEIPINAVYYVPAGSGDFFLSAGAYLGYNISGELKQTLTSNGKSINDSKDVIYSGSNKMMNRWDAGLNFAIGYKFKNGFLVQGGYSLGLLNQNASKSSKNFQNRSMNFGVGYQF